MGDIGAETKTPPAVNLDDKRLDRQQSYQQFHLGVYISLVTVICGATFLAQDKIVHLPLLIPFVAATVFCLMLAGMFGGFVAAAIPSSTSYGDFIMKGAGFSWPGSKTVIFKLSPKFWESCEHLFFWIAILFFFGFGLYYWINVYWLCGAKC